MVILFSHALLSHLVVEDVIELLVLRPRLILVVNVLEASLLVFFYALLDVLFLLPQLELFTAVLDHICHAIHLVLNALSTVLQFLLAQLLLFQGQAHILLDLLSLMLLVAFHLGHSLPLLLHVVLYHFHCSLTRLLLSLCLVCALLFEFGSQLSHAVSLLVLALFSNLHLFSFDFVKHGVALSLRLDHLLLLLKLLFTLNLELFLGLVENKLVEVLALLACLLAQLLSKFDLLIEHLLNLLDALLLLLLLFFLLFFV
mmetsp:Transcript_26051/g.32515  ORF Transcript_26051/g.32515 Transcript_26051/m.32515 type:complete len:257 (-) Transcript_26051:1167-1937(-)